MARYRIALTTSAFPGSKRGAEVDADPDDPATAARVASGVLVPLAAPSSPETPAEAPADEERPRGGRRGRGPKADPDLEQAELTVDAEPAEAGDADEDSATRAEGASEEA